MDCKHCGIELEAWNRFCPSCGTQVSPQAHAAALEPLAETEEKFQQQRRRKSRMIWWLPVAAVLVVAGSFGGYALYERHVGQEVETWRVEAENLALQGHFDAARMELEDALQKRPNHQVLIADLKWTKQGQAIQSQMATAESEAQNGEYDKALTIVYAAEEQLLAGSGPFDDLLKKMVADHKEAITIRQVKAQMQDSKTMEQLIPLFNQLTLLNTPEAKNIADDIRKQMADVAYNKANDLLTQKQFAEAAAAIDQALTYNPDNSKLLSFKDTIAKQQADFEQMEQQRIADAKVSAAKEAEKNRTQAVQVGTVEAGPDNAGNFVIKGEVKNVGTRPISMVQVDYTILDANGTELKHASTYVYPNYLAPGETGKFEDTLYGLANGVKATVTNETWYLN